MRAAVCALALIACAAAPCWAQTSLPRTGALPTIGADPQTDAGTPSGGQLGADILPGAEAAPEAEALPANGELRSLFRLAPPPPEGETAAPTTWSDPTFIRPESHTLPASQATLRMLDKMSGDVRTFDIAVGETLARGRLEITLDACRTQAPELPQDAWAHLRIRDVREPSQRFDGWMIASTPALSALDHQRYDVWVLSCSTVSTEASSGSAKKSD